MTIIEFLASVGITTAVVVPVSLYFGKRWFDTKFNAIENSLKNKIDERFRRSGKTYDLYFDAIREAIGFGHCVKGSINSLSSVTKMANDCLDNDRNFIEEALGTCREVLEGLEREIGELKSHSSKNTMFMPDLFRESRRNYEEIFANYKADFEVWISDPRAMPPPDTRMLGDAFAECYSILEDCGKNLTDPE